MFGMKMKSIAKQLILATAVFGFAIGLGGCQNDAQNGALIGGGLGAIGGAVIGNQVHGQSGEGAAIGAGLGALGGYIIGNEQDKQRYRNSGSYYHDDTRYNSYGNSGYGGVSYYEYRSTPSYYYRNTHRYRGKRYRSYDPYCDY